MSYRSDTLRFVNKVRKYYGAKPLDELEPGCPHDPCWCPISQSIKKGGAVLDAHVSTMPSSVAIGSQKFRLPTGARKLVAGFDKGTYAQDLNNSYY